jgi:hypothetical protein
VRTPMALNVSEVYERMMAGEIVEGDLAVAVMEGLIENPTREALVTALDAIPVAHRAVMASFILDLSEGENVEPHEVLCLGIGEGGRNTRVEEGRVLIELSLNNQDVLRGYITKK